MTNKLLLILLININKHKYVKTLMVFVRDHSDIHVVVLKLAWIECCIFNKIVILELMKYKLSFKC